MQIEHQHLLRATPNQACDQANALIIQSPKCDRCLLVQFLHHILEGVFDLFCDLVLYLGCSRIHGLVLFLLPLPFEIYRCGAQNMCELLTEQSAANAPSFFSSSRTIFSCAFVCSAWATAPGQHRMISDPMATLTTDHEGPQSSCCAHPAVLSIPIPQKKIVKGLTET
jgi:hypothetical protein